MSLGLFLPRKVLIVVASWYSSTMPSFLHNQLSGLQFSNSDIKIIWLKGNTQRKYKPPSLSSLNFLTCIWGKSPRESSVSGIPATFFLCCVFAFSSVILWDSQTDTGEPLILLYLIRETNRIFYVWRPAMCKKPCVMWSLTNCGEYFWTADFAGPLLSLHCQLLTQTEWINIKREFSIPGACLESMNLSLLILFFLLS